MKRVGQGCNAPHLHQTRKSEVRDQKSVGGRQSETIQPISVNPIQRRLRINFQIRSPRVVVIDEHNKPLGELDIREAQKIASERGFDLVEVAPNAKPPVCKILNYGAYQYRLEKAERKQKARQKRIEIKGIRLSLKIGQHDLEVRRVQSQKFLGEGHKVRVELLLRGRENAHRPLGQDIIRKFVASLGPTLTEQPMSMLGGKISMTVGADPKHYGKTQDAPSNE